MNYLKTNADKFQLLLTSKGEASIKTDDTDMKSSSSKNLLGVLTDHKLPFTDHVSELCKKASKKLHALAKILKHA